VHFTLRERFTALAREAKPPFCAIPVAGAFNLSDLLAAGLKSGR
jgi:hypothetical protein